jgi:hypothetical protein
MMALTVENMALILKDKYESAIEQHFDFGDDFQIGNIFSDITRKYIVQIYFSNFNTHFLNGPYSSGSQPFLVIDTLHRNFLFV